MRRRAGSSFRALTAALAAVVLATSCVDGDPAAPSTPVVISLAPEIVAAANSVAGPISRIRVRVSLDEGGPPLSTEVFQVSPDQQAWQIAVDVDLAATAGSSVVLTVELISVVNGVEVVEWSGRIGPIDLSRGSPGVQTVTVYPGPLENLDVTSVDIRTPTRTTLVEGETLTLAVDVVSPRGGAQVVWSSLDGAVATVSGSGVVATHLPGSARIVAQAGPRADTVSLSVRQALVGASLTPDSVLVRAVGDTAQFQGRGLDPRGGTVEDATLSWSVDDPTVARHVGGGRFVTLRHGTATVTVTASRASSAAAGVEALQTESATAKLVVMQGIFALSVTPEELSFTALNRSALLMADARRQDGSPFEDPDLDWHSNDTDVATVDGEGRVRSVGEGTTQIVVSADGLEAEAEVTVTNEGGASGSEIIVAADVDLFSGGGGGSLAGNRQFARNLASNGERPYVVWYLGNGSYFDNSSTSRNIVNYWDPLLTQMEHELDLTVMVVHNANLGLLAGIDPQMVASVWVPMPTNHFSEQQLDQLQAYLAGGGRVVIFAEHAGYPAINGVVLSALYRLGSDVTITGDYLVGAATPMVEDPLTDGVNEVQNFASSWFNLGETDLGLFENQGRVVIFRAGIGERRTQGLQLTTVGPVLQIPEMPTPLSVPRGGGG